MEWFWFQNLRNQGRIPICPTNSATSGHALFVYITECVTLRRRVVVVLGIEIYSMKRGPQVQKRKSKVHSECQTKIPSEFRWMWWLRFHRSWLWHSVNSVPSPIWLLHCAGRGQFILVPAGHGRVRTCISRLRAAASVGLRVPNAG